MAASLANSLPPSLSLQGRSAIVTGSSRNIGLAIALKLAEYGANVAIHYSGSPSSKPKAEKAAEQVRAFGVKTCIVECELEDPQCGDKVVQAALKGLGVDKIEILVNNAALPGPGKVEDDIDPESFDRVFRVNVRAPALLVKALIPHFDPERPNRIVNICSIASRLNFPGYWLYASSKAGIESLTRTWAKELAIKYHCTVNSVLVGATATDDVPDSPARQAAKQMTTAEARLGNPGDIADVVAWLASESSRWTNGDTIGANGGIVIAS